MKALSCRHNLHVAGLIVLIALLVAPRMGIAQLSEEKIRKEVESYYNAWIGVKAPEIGWAATDRTTGPPGWSERRRLVTVYEVWPWDSYQYWETQRAKATYQASSETKNGTNGACSTTVTVTAAAHYPFIRFAPDIDYTFLVYFIGIGNKRVLTKVGYNHNQFPDYEALIAGTLVHKYATSDTGPGIWDLALGPNVKGVDDGPTING